MLNLEVKTALSTGEALDSACEYFVEKQGLQLVEWIAHLHADSDESQELDFLVREFSDRLPKA